MSVDTLETRLRLARGRFVLDVSEALPLEGVTALFGPSGSGKSTWLRAIAGLEKPARGRIALGTEVWFDSAAGVDLPTHRRPVGYLFQDARLFGHLDVAGNLAFADRRNPAGGADLAAVVAALDLQPLLSRRVQGLSGGERQRVALGRTLLRRPRLLLLDEPLAGLDQSRKAEILPYLQSIPEQFGLPTVYVSHDIDEVAQLARRIVVLVDGRVQLSGSAADVVERLDLQPIGGRFEAGVLVEGRVARHDERLHLTHLDLGGDDLSLPHLPRLQPGDTLRVRIRARDVALAVQRPEGISIRNVIAGRLTELVVDTASGSAEARVQLRSAHVRARLTLAAVEALRLETGQPVFVLIKSVSFERADQAR